MEKQPSYATCIQADDVDKKLKGRKKCFINGAVNLRTTKSVWKIIRWTKVATNFQEQIVHCIHRRGQQGGT